MEKPRILFTHSYFLRLDPKQLQSNKPYAPLMTIQAAAVMREAGYPVTLFDVMFAHGPDDIKTVLEKEQPEILVIFDDGFNYLTKMCLTNMREAAWTMAGIARKKGCTVIACSSDATDHYEDYLRNDTDYVLLGEGEETLLELITALETGNPIQHIMGLAFIRNDQINHSPKRPVMKDLDTLPLPAWDLVDFEPYRDRWHKHWGYFSVNIATTRGCPYKCNWCAKPIYGNSYKMRSPGHVIREIEVLKRITYFDHIWFCDDIFGLKRSWVVEFSEEVQRRGLQFKYKIQSRADLLVKEQYIEALHASGCNEAWMGVESGSQKILDAMEKGITIDQVYSATQKLKEKGILPCFFIQFGYPGETADDIRMTIDLICDLMPSDIGISVSYPLPGTKFYETVKDELAIKANWTDSDDLDLMFRHTYSSQFYKKLHRFVHQQFRKKRALDHIRKWQNGADPWNKKNWKRALSYFYYAPSAFFAKRQLKAVDFEAGSSL